MIHIAALALLAFAGSPQPALSAHELAPGVYVLGSSNQFGAANLGWVVSDDHVTLIGVPHLAQVASCLEEVARGTDKPVRAAILTQVRRDDVTGAVELARKGIDLLVQSEGAKVLRVALKQAKDLPAGTGSIHEFTDRRDVGEGRLQLQILAQGQVGGAGDAVVYLPRLQILFAGPLCVHGPRAELAGTDTLKWLAALSRLQALGCKTVVPGRGSVGDASLLDREARFLRELRRQVGHQVAQARTLDDIVKEVKITPGYLVWMPYDQPVREDIEHIYRELTVPLAPFGNPADAAAETRPKALVLIADSPHDPGHIEAGLRRALERAGVAPFVAVDVRALTEENLKQVQLFVILRDGAIWPDGRDKPPVIWMTPAQERAIVSFVERGGGLLALHNATGLYPESGPYLRLVGGTYQGHGPLERFRVTVLDRTHPITRGVADFEVADEQHTPTPDRERVHLLLESRSAEGTIGAAGWAHRAGQGRVCYLANGHTRESQDHSEYQKLLRNAAVWCLGRDASQ